MTYAPRDPFTMERDEPNNAAVTEFGFGRGMHPDPIVSEDMQSARVPYAPPQREDQIRDMQAARRMNTNDPAAEPDPYVAGNPDRYGGQRPLVRERGAPRKKYRPTEPPPKFRRKM